MNVTTLPLPTTPLIGRQQEVQSACLMLQRDEVRLLTFTGVPGVGKTRLAIETARAVSDQFVDGVLFVPLAAIREVDLVASQIAQAMGLRPSANETVANQVRNALCDRALLLVLDNFEQVLEAATWIAELLRSAPRLKLLITSRVALHLSSEYEFTVPPLALVPAEQIGRAEPISPDAMAQSPAVMLFVARAQAVKPDFHLTSANAAVVAQICRQLDGIPLAIELAAARSKVLPPQALLARLTNRLATLTGGARDLPTRQQTLRAAIDWSYGLLQPEEQGLFCCLSIFRNGWTLEAAEAVCQRCLEQAQNNLDPENTVLNRLSALLDHNLIQQVEMPSGDPRFTMLDTLREYAWEQLEASVASETLHKRHADYFLTLAEKIEPALYGAEQEEGLARLELEHENLRAALAWSEKNKEFDLFLRLILALSQFWWRHGHLREERQWTQKILDFRFWILDSELETRKSKIASALYQAGALAWHQGELSQAVMRCQESLALHRELGETAKAPRALRVLALVAIDQGDEAAAQRHLEESLSLCRQLADARGISWSQAFLARVAIQYGKFDQASVMLRENLNLFRQIAEKDGIIYQLQYLGILEMKRGDWRQAIRWFEESLSEAERMGHKSCMAETRLYLGLVHLQQKQSQAALTHLQESLRISQQMGYRNRQSDCYAQLAALALEYELPVCAIRFWRAAQECATEANLQSKTAEYLALKEQIQALSGPAQSAPASVNAVLARQLSVEQVMTELRSALAQAQPPQAQPPQAQPTQPQHVIIASAPPARSKAATPSTSAPTLSLNELTERELMVLRMLTRGLTYSQIAEELVISPRTVEAHLRTIYGKLGVRSRHEATVLALQHQFV